MQSIVLELKLELFFPFDFFFALFVSRFQWNL